MRFAPASFLVLLICICSFACSGCGLLYPDDGVVVEKDDKELNFDAEYYSQNAKDYLMGGQYARAQDQWTKQLKKDPDNWMAHLGVASCDYYLGNQSLDLGDVRSGRTRLEKAETTLREIWDGTIEADTMDVADKPVRQWQAALILALSLRALGDADHMEALVLNQRMGAARKDIAKRREILKAKEQLEGQRDANYAASLDLLERLTQIEHAPEDSILNYAELLQRNGRTDQAEREFLRYLEIAERTRTERLKQRQEMSQSAGDIRTREYNVQIIDEKIDANAKKQVAVLVRLGNIYFDQGTGHEKLATTEGQPEALREQAHTASKRSFSKALSFLNRAQELRDDDIHLLVKMAQCQGRLEQYEAAIANLDEYITRRARDGERMDENLSRAFQLRKEYEQAMKSQLKSATKPQ